MKKLFNTGLGVVIGAVLVIPAIFIAKDMLSDPAVGECVRPELNNANLEFDEVKCVGRQAMFEVAAITSDGSDCPSGDYLAVTNSGEKTCYTLDLGQGFCTKPHEYRNMSEPVDIQAETCTAAAGATRKVEKVHEGKFDKALCRNQELSLAYSKPAKTICMEKP